MADTETAGIGHNAPPVDLIDDLATRYKSSLDQFAELKEAGETAPAEIKDDLTHQKVVETAKKMRVWEAQADAARKIEGEPFKAKVDQVNGFFKIRIEPLEKLRKALTARHTAYTDLKVAEEKKRLAEEAEKRRMAQEEAERQAAESERKRLAALARQREAEEETRRAEAAKQKAIQDQKDAEERAERLKEEEARLAEERKQREEAAARAAAEKKERDARDEAARLEQKRIDDAAAAEARERRREEERKADEAREARMKAQREQRVAEEEATLAKREVKTAAREENAALDSALRDEKRAGRIERALDGPEAGLGGRVRSEHGAVGTTSRLWKSEVVDRNLLDRNALWPFIHGDAISAAVHKWMMAQAPQYRKMPGAVMEQDSVGQIR